MEDQNQKEDTRVEVELDGGAMEVKQFDIAPYIGQKAKIATVDVHYNERFQSYYMRVATEAVAYVDGDEKKPVTASKLYALMSQEGRFGWKKGADLDNFLKSHGVTKPKDLIGKTVIMIPSKPNKEGVQFLQFN